MRGREEGAGRAAMPAWLQQGRDVCLPARSDGNALLAAPRQPAKGGGGRLQPLWDSLPSTATLF